MLDGLLFAEQHSFCCYLLIRSMSGEIKCFIQFRCLKDMGVPPRLIIKYCTKTLSERTSSWSRWSSVFSTQLVSFGWSTNLSHGQTYQMQIISHIWVINTSSTTDAVWSMLQSSEHQNDQTQEQFLPSGNPSHEHLTFNVEHTTLLYIIYSPHILIFHFKCADTRPVST